MDHTRIKELELLGHNAWLAEEKLRLGGWLLRADHGVTRRANSVLPLESPGLPLVFAIESVLEFYNCRQLVPRFQMTETSMPVELDRELERRGFSIGLQVEVWTAPLTTLLSTHPSCETVIFSEISNDWTDTYNRSSGHDPSTIAIRLSIMERTLQPRSYAKALIGGVTAAVGFGVVEKPRLGMFNIASHPDMRHRGAATSVNTALGKWAQQLGAEYAYLQVEKDNIPAKALYTKLGFEFAYRYWYRDLNNAK
jgi:ribosomal protein S18 acetylase RimI-like enzyme